MGLDVSVYRNIKKCTNEEDYCFTAHVIDEQWNYKIKNLKKDADYSGLECDASVSYGYGSHSSFRRLLLEIIGRKDLINDDEIKWEELSKETEMPFYELINFADNEGCLDWEISEKLYEEFVFWKVKAISYLVSNGWLSFSERYLDWLNVFKNGKDKGVVVFH